MSLRGAIKAVLEADATLLATLTGGVYDKSELGRRGISPTSTPGAYGDQGTLKPLCVVKARGSTVDGALADDAHQYASFRQVVELWFYQESGDTALETAMARAAALLHGKQVTDSFVVRWIGNPVLDREAPELEGVSVTRSDYEVISALSA